MSWPSAFIYRLNWQSFHEGVDIQCYIDIANMDAPPPPDGSEPNIYNLTPADPPAVLSVIDNSDDPFTPIRAKQLTFSFVSDLLYNLTTFATGHDQKWFVHYYISDGGWATNETIFQGYMVLDDISEPLLSDQNIVTLTATDNLGLLKDVPFKTDAYPLLDYDEGVNPVGMYKISEILALCLKKTGLELDLRVVFNIKQDGHYDDIRVADTTDEHFFSKTYIDAKTFEDEIGTCENCYSVIEKILGYEACLFQSYGQWWIMRVDEVENPVRGVYVSKFDSDGLWVGKSGSQILQKEINDAIDITFADEASTVQITRPHKYVRLDYNFDDPSELIYNGEFTRGDYLSDLSATEKLYTIEGWTQLLLHVNTGAESFDTTAAANIYKKFNANGTIIEQYVRFTEGSFSSTLLHAIKSQSIPLGQGDKFTISGDFRTDQNEGMLDLYPVCLKFVKDDGTVYVWSIGFADNPFDGLKYKWRTGGDITGYASYSAEIDDTYNDYTTDWQGWSVVVDPVPGDGKLYVYLFAHMNILFPDQITHISNLRFEYEPLINGSYKVYDGQYHQVTRPNEDGKVYKAKVLEDIYVSDSPKKLFKGGLQKISSWTTISNVSTEFLGTPDFQSFRVSGFNTSFFVGQILSITGTVSNNMTTRVLEVTYTATHTYVTTTNDTIIETVTATIQEPVFILAGNFYNAAVSPTGTGGDPTLAHPYGWVQIFDVYNQFNYPRRLIQGTLQGLDLDEVNFESRPDMADISIMWSPTDASFHLLNKRFLLLSFEQNHSDQGWTGTFREVVDLTRSKEYSGNEFKYIERGGNN